MQYTVPDGLVDDAIVLASTNGSRKHKESSNKNKKKTSSPSRGQKKNENK